MGYQIAMAPQKGQYVYRVGRRGFEHRCLIAHVTGFLVDFNAWHVNVNHEHNANQEGIYVKSFSDAVDGCREGAHPWTEVTIP